MILACIGLRMMIFSGWTAFILENLVLSENRQSIIDAFGDDNYHLAYSSLSTIACGSILYGYLRYGRGKGVPLSPPGSIRNSLSFFFRSLGLVGLSQQVPLLRMPYTYESGHTVTATDDARVESVPTKKWRCPMDFAQHDGAADSIKGMERISRHSTFWYDAMHLVNVNLMTYMSHKGPWVLSALGQLSARPSSLRQSCLPSPRSSP